MKVLLQKLRSKTRQAPSLDAVDDELIVDLAIKDFYLLREQGIELSPAAYAKQYPPGIESLLLTDLQFEESLCELDASGVMGELSSSSGLSSWKQEQEQSDDKTVWPIVGDNIGGLTLVEQIGRGKFSRVYSAQPTPDAPQVAVKLCRRLGNHEARTLENVSHSAIGVVQSVESVPETDLVAIRMPLKSRTTLADVLRSVARSGSVPVSADIVWDEVQSRNKLLTSPPAWAGKSYVAWAQNAMSTLAEALSEAHSQSTAHCDIKPPNVLINAEGNPILIDFNLSLRWDVESSSPNIGGTLPYMAPEQLQAFETKQQGDIGPRTDIYGLAATIYQLLTGELPFRSPSDGNINETLKLRKTRPRPIREKNPHIPPAFASVIMKCLNYHPKDRPRTTADLVALLNQGSTSRGVIAMPQRLVMIAVPTIALATVAVAIAFPSASSSELPKLSIATPDRVVTPEQSEANIIRLLNDGYDAYEADDFELAAENFLNVLELDPGHDGAAIGCVRAQFQLGNNAAAGVMLTRISNLEVPELHALKGLCLAATANYEMAAFSFELALEGELENREVLTNYAHCLVHTSRYAEAVDVCEQARLMEGDTSVSTLILARAYSMLWRRRGKNGKPIHRYDTELLVSLIEECPECPARSLTAAILYSGLARQFGRNDEKVKTYWIERSLTEFTRGCELGLHPDYWNSIKHVMPNPDAPPGALEVNLSARPSASLSQYRSFYLLDPLADTRFERYCKRSLSPK